jgi:hypothetical protein
VRIVPVAMLVSGAIVAYMAVTLALALTTFQPHSFDGVVVMYFAVVIGAFAALMGVANFMTARHRPDASKWLRVAAAAVAIVNAVSCVVLVVEALTL